MATTETLPAAIHGATFRQEFGASEVQRTSETAASAVAAQAKAAVEARYVLAMRKPRNWDKVRVDILKECERPSFAAVARYVKPIGNDEKKWPKGPSIRFAEAALRCMTNVFPETQIIYDSDEQRIIQVTVTDLESNLTYSSQIVLGKTIERKKKDGRQVFGERTNSYGDTVYIVGATEDELLNKQKALISKALRTNGLRLLPGDILDEAMQRVVSTLSDRTAKDPDAEKKSLIDGFTEFNVSPVDLETFLGHSLDRVQPIELTRLREIWYSIRDGETTWDEVMENRGGATGSAEAQQDILKRKMEMLKQKPAEPTGSTREASVGTAEGKAPSADDGQVASANNPQPAEEKPTAGKLQFGRRN